jgi:hypothetical protein
MDRGGDATACLQLLFGLVSHRWLNSDVKDDADRISTVLLNSAPQ